MPKKAVAKNMEVARFSIVVSEETGYALVPLAVFEMLCNGASIVDAVQVHQTIQIAIKVQ